MSEIVTRIEAGDIWNYCRANTEKLKQCYVDVAWSEKYSVAVTAVTNGGVTRYKFAVFEGSCEEPEYEEFFVTSEDATDTAERIFTKYLFGNGFTANEDEFQEEADATQSNIENAVQDLILVLTGGDLSATLLVEDDYSFLTLVDEICSTVASFGVSVYRPMKIFPKGKAPVYSLYPYDEYTYINSATGEAKE